MPACPQRFPAGLGSGDTVRGSGVVSGWGQCEGARQWSVQRHPPLLAAPDATSGAPGTP